VTVLGLREHHSRKESAERDHVILCGFGRVGQNIARVLEVQGFEYIALDLDPARIRAARQAGDPVIFGDSSDEEMLDIAGLAKATAVVISFSDPGTAVNILHSVRRVRPDVPVLVRTVDDGRLHELKDAGATDVVPETFEASLTLVSQVLMLLKVPSTRVMRIISDIRGSRYAVLRNVLTRDWERPIEHAPGNGEELRTVVSPPGAWAVGRTLEEVRSRGAEVAFTGIRRQGILGREPEPDAEFREGDIVVIYGDPKNLEHAESVMLAG
jgi:CPA2 family monovalent cation:H+ antiporter-2